MGNGEKLSNSSDCLTWLCLVGCYLVSFQFLFDILSNSKIQVFAYQITGFLAIQTRTQGTRALTV